MPYEILEPEPKGYEVLEPEAEPKPVKRVEDAIPDWMKGGNTPMAATVGGAAAVPVSSLTDTLKSKAFQEALNTSPLQRVGLTPDLVIPGTAAPKPLQPITVPIAAGAKMALGLANAFTTPKGLMELGALFTPAAPLVAGKWIYDMVKGAGESAGDLTEKITRLIKDPQSFTAQDVQAVGDDVVNFIGQAAGAGGLGAHQIARIKARIDPRTDFGKKLSAELDKTTSEETKTVAAAAQTLPAAAAEAEKSLVSVPERPTSAAIKDLDTGEIWSGEPTHGQLHEQIPNRGSRRLEAGFLTNRGNYWTQAKTEAITGRSSGEELFGMSKEELDAWDKAQEEVKKYTEKGVAENAIQERGATEIPVGETPGDRGKVVEGAPGAKEPAIPQVQEEVPRTETGSGRLLLIKDRQRYDELMTQFSALQKAKDYEGIAKIWPEIEAIKNRHGGLPPPETPSAASGQKRILIRQYGDLPKGTVVTLTGEKSLDPINQWVGVKLPSGEIAHISPASIAVEEIPTRSLPQLLGELGEEKLGSLISYWDQNAELSPDKKTIIGVQDPRNPTAKARLSTRDFIKWLSSDEGIEAQAALKKAEPPPPVTGEAPRQPVSSLFQPTAFDLEGHKSRSKIVDMPISDFLKLAARITDVERGDAAERALQKGIKWESLPSLLIESAGDKSRVIAHEGRNRAEALLRRGYTTMPVEIRDRSIRWSEQDSPEKFDYEAKLPSTLEAEKGGFVLPFPITRETAARQYKAESPAATPQATPRQPVPEGAAPEGERAPAVSAAEPPGTTKGDISTPKEQVPVLGPGAKTVGEPPYSAAQLLTDQLKATPPTGTKEGLSLREKIADKWAQGKTLFERAFGTGRAISESLKETARGVRDITDLDRRVGELDYLLQRSSGLSKNMKKAILQQQPNKATREAVALWIDAGGDVGRLRDTLAKLPPETAPSIRRALERAINLPPEAVQFAEGLKQFYGIRLNDAQQAGVFEKFLDDYYTHVWQKPSNMPEDLRAHYSTGRVSDYFQFARQRSIPTFLDGILQGMKPILDPAEVLPGYNYALDRAIASRKFVKELSEINAPDGRPAVLPTGTAERVTGESGGMFINPKGKGELGKDYHVIDHPAMRKWKWMGTDENGNPVMYRSDLAANPGVHERLARMLDQRLATPSKWGKRLLRASTEVKGLKLGLLSAFHQVHVGSHANWHWTNPFKGGEIDWDAPETRFAIEKGHLKLAGDAADVANFAEGLISPGLVHKIPIVGPWSKAYSEWVFTVLIPRLKLNTFKNAYPRNLKHYAKDIQSGRITEEQIAARVGDSVNNAYGELNHWFLGKYGRSPQFQRILRGVFLAPDFGEARLRFAAKALTRYGMEERLAFATMIGTMYLAARVGNWLSHGDPELDIKNAFRVKVGKEWVSMRSVAGDLLHAITNFGQFMYVRLNPLYSRTISDVLFQRDVYGRKLSMGDILLKRPAQQLVPINLTGLTREDQKLWESAITSMGLQVQHDVPAMDIGKLKRQWLLKNPDPKLRAMGERSEQELFPSSDYSKLRRALIDNDMKKAKAEYESLQKDKGKKHTDIVKALSPISGGRIVNGRYVDTKIKPIGGEIGYANEQKFRASLTPAEHKLYLQALTDRKLIFQRFQAMMAGTGPRVTEDVR